jgi:hypothetical protein
LAIEYGSDYDNSLSRLMALVEKTPASVLAPHAQTLRALREIVADPSRAYDYAVNAKKGDMLIFDPLVAAARFQARRGTRSASTMSTATTSTPIFPNKCRCRATSRGSCGAPRGIPRSCLWRRTYNTRRGAASSALAAVCAKGRS